ncbi:hypothetical protein [Methanimicrococcus blatticola]|uniref:Uncharacterized protein n=1 Tax=Methanimicrococcus blatticola TaxID=91560 RepID=A0A484F4Z0_9EURY|nr:hypothetical protein [Methanimicrococcus blatticola]MBZ3935812.1 hypothetical protein [Methanimicrococcus blatticola]TDQ68852.1 hypothetical protein C7391_1050 [Methanimicrococcus blatticola]
MNIENLIQEINLFQDFVIKSGFKRDLQDYIQAIQLPQNKNLTFMKDLSMKIRKTLEEIEDNEIDDDLALLLKETKPFTDLKTKMKLEELDKNTEIEAEAYYQNFQHLLKDLLNKIEKNEQEIAGINGVFSKYVENEEIESEEGQALVSLIFKDNQTTKRLEKFADSLYHWNRALLTYNSLLRSECPEDISLVEIQNGSVDVIFETEPEIAADLAESVKVGLTAFGAYLARKSMTKDIIESYLGNEKLIRLEKQIDELMLDNVKESVAGKIEEQYTTAIRNGGGTSVFVDEKINEISMVLTEHIIRGNELKLLTPLGTDSESGITISEDLRRKSVLVQKRLRQLDAKDRKSLEEYTIKESFSKKTLEYEAKQDESNQDDGKKEMIELGKIKVYDNETIEAYAEEAAVGSNFEYGEPEDPVPFEINDDEMISLGDGTETYGADELYGEDKEVYAASVYEEVPESKTDEKMSTSKIEDPEEEMTIDFSDESKIHFGKKKITASGNFIDYGNDSTSDSGYRIGMKTDESEKTGSKKRILDFIY